MQRRPKGWSVSCTSERSSVRLDELLPAAWLPRRRATPLSAARAAVPASARSANKYQQSIEIEVREASIVQELSAARSAEARQATGPRSLPLGRRAERSWLLSSRPKLGVHRFQAMQSTSRRN